MRFSSYSINEQIVRKYFAILPIRINNETRWFETVEYVQECVFDEFFGWKWIKITFIDETNISYYSGFKRYGRIFINFNIIRSGGKKGL